jgi:2-polyprenyl-3-methyl-5-hydroxy-6-metoxy-1,4-benzoquinol methylase
MDVSDSDSIIDTLNKTGGDFDVIIDDMIHNVHHNALFAKQAYKYLKVGGCLIIEDICQKDNNYYGDNFYELYYEYLKDIIPYFSYITYIESRHKNLYSGDWDNDRLLVMVRNENK